jgi:hypothetical protein
MAGILGYVRVSTGDQDVTGQTEDRVTWQSERARVWAQSTLLHRARIINRFLDHLVLEGLVANNPIDEPRADDTFLFGAICVYDHACGKVSPPEGK